MDQGGRSDENARNHPHSPRARGERCARAAARYKFYQGIVARELKKQLAPLNDKLDALQAENRMLRVELEKKNAPAEEQN